jgi:hypothetical protein
MILDIAMKQQFLDTIDTRLKQALQPQIILKNTLDTILMIAGKHDAANHTTGI